MWILFARGEIADWRIRFEFKVLWYCKHSFDWKRFVTNCLLEYITFRVMNIYFEVYFFVCVYLNKNNSFSSNKKRKIIAQTYSLTHLQKRIKLNQKILIQIDQHNHTGVVSLTVEMIPKSRFWSIFIFFK